jgi:hypothetical protein
MYHFFKHCATGLKASGLISDMIHQAARPMILGSTQPLTGVTTTDVSLGVKAVLPASTSWIPQGVFGHIEDLLYLYLHNFTMRILN